MGGFIRIVVLLAAVVGGVYLYSGGGRAPTRPAAVTAPLPPPSALLYRPSGICSG